MIDLCSSKVQSKSMWRALALGTVVACGSLLGGCVGGDVDRHQEHQPSSASSDAAVKQREVVGMGQLAESMGSVSHNLPAPIVSKVGTQGTGNNTYDVVVDVYNLSVGDNYTYLSWSVRLQEPGHVSFTGNSAWINGDESTSPFTSGDMVRLPTSHVALHAGGTGQSVFPLQRPLGDAGREDNVTACMCSSAPRTLTGNAYLMDSYYPSLTPDSNTVNLEIPGFPLIENIPVSRE